MVDPRLTVIGVLHGDLGDRACFDRYQVMQMAGLQWAWTNLGIPDHFNWWMVDTFIQNEAEKTRMRRVYDEVAIFFHDLAKLHDHAHGTEAPGIHEMTRAFRRRLLCAFRPETREVLDGATHGQPAVAAANLKRLTSREDWLATYPRG